jgi:hypothetical protein
LQTRQGREPDVEGGGELGGEDVLAALACEQLLAAVEPGAAQKLARKQVPEA